MPCPPGLLDVVVPVVDAPGGKEAEVVEFKNTNEVELFLAGDWLTAPDGAVRDAVIPDSVDGTAEMPLEIGSRLVVGPSDKLLFDRP